jgi:hypothetical protein
VKKHKPLSKLQKRLAKIIDAVSNFYVIDTHHHFVDEIAELDRVLERMNERLEHDKQA